jgi:hypothetical protein
MCLVKRRDTAGAKAIRASQRRLYLKATAIPIDAPFASVLDNPL